VLHRRSQPLARRSRYVRRWHPRITAAVDTHCGHHSNDLMLNAMLDACIIAEPCRSVLPRLGCYGGLLAVLSIMGPAFGQSPDPQAGLQHCRTITDDAARLRCFEEATSKPTGPQSSPAPERGQKPGPKAGASIGTWRLVRTPNPVTGADAVSIMRTADIVKSDIDLAGLMLRCAQNNFEVIVVLVRPLPPRAHPKVTVGAGGNSVDFTATVLPPGAEVLLPADASALASGPWRTAPELSVQISSVNGDEPPAPVHGIIPLAGLGDAIQLLLSNCPSR
jgi:hypothetical protein